MKHAIAKAYPIQGLIKYHGLRDKELRLPYHDSISVCTGEIYTKTLAMIDRDYNEDIYKIEGRRLEGKEKERLDKVVDKVRELSGLEYKVHLFSDNYFPSNIGLGASSSGFAAAAVALCKAYELNLPLRKIAEIARLGATSAGRSVIGGFSIAYEDGTFDMLAGPGDLQMSIIAVPIKGFKYTDDAHADAETSPYFQTRIKDTYKKVIDMYKAIKDKDVKQIGRLAEQDTHHLHAITMTGEKGKRYWKPDTIRVMDKVEELRKQGYPVYYSTDTGASVYINSPVEFRYKIEKEIRSLGLGEIFLCDVGGSAHLIKEPYEKLARVR